MRRSKSTGSVQIVRTGDLSIFYFRGGRSGRGYESDSRGLVASPTTRIFKTDNPLVHPSKSKIVFRSLPEIVIDRKLVSLACAECDLVELAVLVGNRAGKCNSAGFECGPHSSNANTDVVELQKIFERSPLLLIFALSEFVSFGISAATDASQLATWFLESGIRRLNRGLTSNQASQRIELAVKSRKYMRAYADFQTGRGNKSLRKCLARILKTTMGVHEKKASRWIELVVGSELKAEAFNCRRIGSNGRRGATREPAGYQPGDFGTLFQLAAKAKKNDAEFGERLLEEKLLAMKGLAYGASHEINNPLANIASRAQTMLKSETVPEQRRKLAVIYHQAMRAHEMISDLMLFAHPPAARPENCDLHRIARAVAREWQANARDAGAKIRVNIYPGVADAHIDGTQVAAALAALVRNAVEAVDAGNSAVAATNTGNTGFDYETTTEVHSISAVGAGQIEISIWSRDDRTISISVTDNGRGPTEENCRHMFDPFYSGREAGRGLGFGLSKAWRICRINGGSLRYDATWTGGTRFVISLPVAGLQPEQIKNAAA